MPKERPLISEARVEAGFFGNGSGDRLKRLSKVESGCIAAGWR
jgi:hypothetical protein